MLLTIDAGNTHITLGLYRDDELVFTARLATDTKKTADEFGIDLYNLFLISGISKEEIKGAVISSVVPPITGALEQAIVRVTGQNPLTITPGVKTGLNIMIDNPAQLGADLVAGGVGAIAKYEPPIIVFDLGTATTISVIDKRGNFLGGAIAPGIKTAMEALTGNTAALPDVSLKSPPGVIGRNTIDCMNSGLIIGSAAMLDGFADRILEQLMTRKASLVATGGLAPEIIRHCRHDIIYDDTLLLWGLKCIYEKNVKE